MSEFTKLGGYLIQGQPEVVHDNTLSGNGLEGSPLGISEQVSEVNDLVHSNSGTWNEVSTKLDTTATANFYTTANESGFISEVPVGTMNESAFGYDSDNKISSYNGSAIGGSDVPEGVMVESSLEYNAVNEISAYNGSAIAQYGAEKQWLVHDDTLVHASNSAQYALGVNLSAVAQLLGVDETVLWSGDAAQASLSESFSSFKKIDIWYTYWPGKYTTKRLYGWIDGTQPSFTEGWFDENGAAAAIFISRFSANADKTQISFITNKYWNPPNGSTLTNAISNAKIEKIIGIGRKQ